MDDNDNKSLEGNDDSNEDGSGPPSDEEEDVVDMPPCKPPAHITSTKHGCHGGTSNVPAQQALIGELDAYREKGALQPTKHLWAIHNGYCQRIHQLIGLHDNPRVLQFSLFRLLIHLLYLLLVSYRLLSHQVDR